MWTILKLNRCDYQKALELQTNILNKKINGDKINYLLVLEHPLTYTVGKSADTKNFAGLNPILIARGGDITFHAPGQIIFYIILNLKDFNLDLHKYIRKLELLIIEILNKYNLKAYQKENFTGVWLENKKIASIGIGVKKYISMHGISLNINVEKKHYEQIKPCGLAPEGIGNLSDFAQINPGDIEKSFSEIIQHWF